MRFLSFSTLVLALALGLLLAGPAATRAADKDNKAGDKDADKPEKVKFDTVDGVELHGDYYAPGSGVSKKAPCVLLLHKINSDRTKDGWEKLARDLQKAGYAVLIFDFRGHGDSTAVSPNFWFDTTPALAWQTRFNRDQYRLSVSRDKPKEAIGIKDFKPSYYPALVNDIAAAKFFLDRRNASGECNSNNLILIGAEDGATLGALWMASELSLYRVTAFNPLTALPMQLATTPEGKEISAAVWLSISPRLGSYTVSVSSWLQYAGKEHKIPMAFIVGEKDTAASFTRTCFTAVKPPPDSKASKLTGECVIKDSKLAGNALLGDKVNVPEKFGGGTTRKWIVDSYLKAIKDEQVAPAWEDRDIEKTPFAWRLPGSRAAIMAKHPNDKSFAPVPPSFLNLR
jgi:pimeloyl-ACP methyl ester carboxylesterase